MGELRGHYAKWKNQSQKENTEWSHFHENSKIVKFIEVASRMVVARHGGTKFQLWKWVDSSDLTYINMTISSVQFSHSVVSNSLRPHEPPHARPPCPSPTPGVHTNPCPLSQWCHPTISSSVVPFSSCPQPFPTLGSFQMSQLLASGGQSTGVSASTSVLPMNTQHWSPLEKMEWLYLLAVQRTLKSLLQHDSSEASILWCSAFFIVQLLHPYMITGKTIALTRQTLSAK